MCNAGASVIYADTVADLGYADELGNYAEYSGAPNLQVYCHLCAWSLQQYRCVSGQPLLQAAWPTPQGDRERSSYLAVTVQETYQYAKTLLGCATSHVDGRKRALLVGGGIANFTDVAATFKGIIRAITENVDAIKAAKLRIYVRRGGPNYEAGLELMQKLGRDSGLQIDVFGPTTSMTGICKLAIDYIEG